MSQAHKIQPQLYETIPLSERLATLLSLTQSLTGIIIEENRLLREKRPAALKTLIEEKNRLGLHYNRELSQLRNDKSAMQNVDRALRLALRDATTGFREALDENQRILKRLRKVNEGLVQSIGNEVARRNKPVQNYGANARMDGAREATTLALNQTF